MPRFEVKELTPILKEMEGAPPRSSILVGVAVVEYCLEQALKSVFREPQSNADRDALFSQRFLNDLEEKIWAAYFVRLIGPKRRSDLDTLRRIRNECAHNPNEVGFNIEPTASRIG